MLSLALPVVWVITVRVFGAYEWRFLGTGSDEFRRVLNAGLSLTGALALISYAVNNELSRLYLVISMQVIVVLDLVVRYALRKRLHRLRRAGACACRPSWRSVTRTRSASSSVSCAVSRTTASRWSPPAWPASPRDEVAGVPVVGDLDDAASVVRNLNAGTVAVLSCPEMDGVKLRTLAWELEKTGTDLCVAPALLDVAGPRTTVRPTAGLTLLHVDHPQLSGPRQVIKDLFDRCAAAFGLAVLSPLLLAIALIIKLSDNGPALFTQTRVGKGGEPFKIYKFRTMVVERRGACWPTSGRRTSPTGCSSRSAGIRASPRIGARLRKSSLDELPQLINVLKRRDVAGRPASRAAGGGGEVRRPRAPPACREAGPDRHVAGERSLRPVVGGVGAHGPALRRELVVRP